MRRVRKTSSKFEPVIQSPQKPAPITDEIPPSVRRSRFKLRRRILRSKNKKRRSPDGKVSSTPTKNQQSRFFNHE